MPTRPPSPRTPRRPAVMRVVAALAAAVLSTAAAAPAPGQPMPHWMAPRTEKLSPEQEAEERRLDDELDELTRAGKYFDALSAAERLLELREKALGPKHAHTLVAAIWVANNSRRIGDYNRAESLLKRVISVLEQGGTPRWWYFSEINALATVYSEMGDFRRAEPLYQSLLGEEVQQIGSSSFGLSGLARMYRAKGDFAHAEPLYERLLAEKEKVSADARAAGARLDPWELGVALTDMAAIHRLRGQHARAELLFQRAVTILEAWKGTPEMQLAACLNEQALLYHDMGDHGRAEPLFQRALALRERELRPTDPAIAEILQNLGALLWDKGEHARAESLYRRALSILQDALGPEHPRVAACQSALEGLTLAQGELPGALELRRAALSAEDRRLTRLLAIGSEADKRAFSAELERSTSATISLHLRAAPRDADAAKLALTTIVRRKGRVLDAVTDGLALVRRDLAEPDRELLDRLARVHAELGARVYTRARGDSSARGLEEEQQRLEAEVSRRSAVFRAEQRPTVLEDVQAAVPEGSALIELALYRPYRPEAKLAERFGPLRYAAYVLRRSGSPAFADLGEAAAIDAGIEELRRALASPVRDAERLARGMDARIMAPIRPLLGDARNVLVSPAGALGLLPFGALVDENRRYLVENYSFTYLTSGRDLLRVGAGAEPRQGAVIVANPAFDDRGAVASPQTAPCEGCGGTRSIDMGAIRFGPLPGTAAEARALQPKLRGARVLTGAEATEAAVKALLGPRILHVATHGFFLPARALQPEAPVHAGDNAVSRARAAALAAENPLLRAGLAFAGANPRQSGPEDGILTAAEASALDLRGTKLVVLSACETGLGEASPGEGVQGLRRALVVAGSETQVISLWRLDDEATSTLMAGYYDRLMAGAGRSEAMRQAQLGLFRQGATAHPYYWAGFIVSGEGTPLPRSGAAPVKAPTGPRGCACSAAGEPGGPGGASAALAAVLALALRAPARRRTAGRR